MEIIKLRYDPRPAGCAARSRAPSSASSHPAISKCCSNARCRTPSARSRSPRRCAAIDEVWEAVVADFVERASPGGLRISINDGGARPDTVALRLMQGVRMMEAAR